MKSNNNNTNPDNQPKQIPNRRQLQAKTPPDRVSRTWRFA
jgi:hypothetical protein